jgi:hypothetical protein
MQSYLGVANFISPFIPGYVDIMAPLYDMIFPGNLKTSLMNIAPFLNAPKQLLPTQSSYIPQITAYLGAYKRTHPPLPSAVYYFKYTQTRQAKKSAKSSVSIARN